MIINAVVGLILALTSYILLYTLNPNLVKFKSLNVGYISGGTYIEGLQNFDSIPNLKWTGEDSKPYCQKECLDALAEAAQIMVSKKKELIIMSGTRSLEQQQAEYDRWCKNGKCEHPVCYPSVNCPHVSGKALDIEHSGSTIDSDMVAAMKQAGFCQLMGTNPPEPWHFEKPKLSS